MRQRVLPRILPTLLVATFSAQAASATTVHGDFFGANFDYLDVQETSSFGDPEPLFGAPIIVGDALVFSPTTFSASAAGAGGFDQTGAQLQATIVKTTGGGIDVIAIEELGEVDLSGIGGPATGAFIGIAGVVTVLEGPASCVGHAQGQIHFVGTFTPSDLYGLPAAWGQTLFTGQVLVDVGAVCPGTTKAFLSLDNDMVVSSEAGTMARLQKKPTLIITAVSEPENASLPPQGALCGLGFELALLLPGLMWLHRRRRRTLG